jgi:chromosome segregation ATPase
MSSPGRSRGSQTAELSCPDLRKSILASAAELQRFIPFQASVQPHIEHLMKEIQALKAQADQHKAKIKEMEKELEAPHSLATQITDEEHETKIALIHQLEEQYQNLLAEKAKYLELGEQETAF